MPPEHQPTHLTVLDRFRVEFDQVEPVNDVLSWVEANPQGWEQRVAEFDQTITTMNQMLASQTPVSSDYHHDFLALKEVGITSLPTLGELASLKPPENLTKGRLEFSCKLIGGALNQVKEQMAPGGTWNWVTNITEPHQALSGLLIEGYGYLLSQAHPEARADLRRNFVLAFEEILWTNAKESSWGETPRQVSLLNDVILWMTEEKDSFPAKLADEMAGGWRYLRRWGDHRLFGNDPSIMNESPEGLARMMAWSQACPNPKAVMTEYGVMWTLRRYSECNFCYGWLFDRAEKLNEPLAQELVKGIWRGAQDKVGAYDPLFTPDHHKWLMSEMSTAWGYALPRVLIEQFGRDGNRNQDRMLKGIAIAESVIKKSKTPAEFLARLSNEVVKADADPAAVLGHVFAVELESEGAGSSITLTVQAIKRHAPQLWEFYRGLSPDQRARAGMMTNLS
jgi:hypothetical protein